MKPPSDRSMWERSKNRVYCHNPFNSPTTFCPPSDCTKSRTTGTNLPRVLESIPSLENALCRSRQASSLGSTASERGQGTSQSPFKTAFRLRLWRRGSQILIDIRNRIRHLLKVLRAQVVLCILKQGACSPFCLLLRNPQCIRERAYEIHRSGMPNGRPEPCHKENGQAKKCNTNPITFHFSLLLQQVSNLFLNPCLDPRFALRVEQEQVQPTDF